MNFVVVDIEAKLSVTDWSQPWLAGMGSAVTYHPTDLFKLWKPNEIHELVDYLNAADLIVGYAIKHYDLKVLERFVDKKITTPIYDLCDFAAEALKRRVKLNEVLDATLGLAKTGNGADAPHLFQAGKFKELFEYNVNDVLLEYLLFRFARDKGYLLVWDSGRLFACPCPDPREVMEGR